MVVIHSAQPVLSAFPIIIGLLKTICDLPQPKEGKEFYRGLVNASAKLRGNRKRPHVQV
ncbi:hypothetical protein D3C84_1295930 [compost metagenome]